MSTSDSSDAIGGGGRNTGAKNHPSTSWHVTVAESESD